MKKICYLVNFATYNINPIELDTNDEYYEYCKPWRFNSQQEAHEAIKERIKFKIHQIDEKIEELNRQREELVNDLFSI